MDDRQPRGRPRARRCDGERGQSLVEFALTLPLLLVMLLFAIDVGRLFYVYIGVQNAAREAAAYAAGSAACQAGGSTCTDAAILATARQEVGGDTTLVVNAATCTTSCTKSSGLNEYWITIAVSRPFLLIPGVTAIPGVGGATFPGFTLGASATAVIQ